MSKNIVICSDGTGNAFAKKVSNVMRLIKSLALDRPEQQIVLYDQGIGTHSNLVRSVEAYAAKDNSRCALRFFWEPRKLPLLPALIPCVLGLAFGYGLRDNVRQMYQFLSKEWGTGDQVFLIGFSRGAFTVRALAGLVYRCGLARSEVAGGDAFEQCFERAWALYAPHEPVCAAIEDYKQKFGVPNACRIRFLGLWDTVKSYGGIWPRSLPHLRHNPIVLKVRHALALNEKRSWFIPTSWGGIDGDDLEQLGVEDDPRYGCQDVQEVWFRGCHSDVGGGDKELNSAVISLRWMLREAKASGLMLSPDGEKILQEDDPSYLTEIHESLTCGWLFSEYIPRWELDNSQRPPRRLFKIGRSGVRHVDQFSRKGKINVHQSARQDYHLRTVEFIHSIP